MTFDLYVWKSPRDLDSKTAGAMIRQWNEAGGDPASSPFEPSTDVGWFYRELLHDEPGLTASSDATPTTTGGRVWLATEDEPPARVVRVPLTSATSRHALSDLESLAAKYDLVMFDTRTDRLTFPLEDLAAYASATFWPGGAIQAAVAGGIGGLIAVVAWLVGIPVLSGVLVLVGGFLVVMAVFTFVHEGRKAWQARRTQDQ